LVDPRTRALRAVERQSSRAPRSRRGRSRPPARRGRGFQIPAPQRI